MLVLHFQAVDHWLVALLEALVELCDQIRPGGREEEPGHGQDQCGDQGHGDGDGDGGEGCQILPRWLLLLLLPSTQNNKIRHKTTVGSG